MQNTSSRKETFSLAFVELKDDIVWNRKMKDEFLKRGDFNVIIVYWPGGATAGYFQAAGNTRLVGAQVAYLIEQLRKYQRLPYSNVHILGFSLGGQIAGFAGRKLREKGHRIARITGREGFNSHA